MERKLNNAVATTDRVGSRVFIPGWEPVDFEMGLRWARSQIYEGYYVDFKCSGSDIMFIA